MDERRARKEPRVALLLVGLVVGLIASLVLGGPPARASSQVPLDDFSDAYLTFGSNLYLEQLSTSNTKEPGEPSHAGQAGGHSAWWAYAPERDGQVKIDTCDSGVDTVLGAYTASNPDAPSVSSLVEVASDNNSAATRCGSGDDEIQFRVTANRLYYVAVDGVAGAVGSYRIRFVESPQNDQFERAEQLVGGITIGNNRLATVQAGEPRHAGYPGGHSVWFRWRAERAGPVKLTACSSAFDALLGVYTGSSVSALTTVVADDDGGRDNCSSGGSLVRFNAIAGQTYQFAVDGKNDSTGFFVLELHTRPQNDDFAAAFNLPDAVDGFSGDTDLASREASEPEHGGSGGRSVWFRWAAPAAGRVLVQTCGSEIDTLLGVYTGSSVGTLNPVAVNDDSGSEECGHGASALGFDAVAGSPYFVAVDAKGGAEGAYNLDLRQVPANDSFENPLALSGRRVLEPGSNLRATKQSGEPNHAGSSGGASVWFRWSPAQTGTYRIDTCGSAIDTLLGVYRGSAVNALTEVASDNSSGGESCGAGSSKLSLNATAGESFRIAIDGIGGTQGAFRLRIFGQPDNDDLATARSLNAAEASFTDFNYLASAESGEPAHAASSASRSIWYRWRASSSDSITIDTCYSPLDTVVAVYRILGSGQSGLSPVASDDDGGVSRCGSGDSRVSFEAVAGTDYAIAVDGKAGGEGGFLFTMRGADKIAPATTLLAGPSGTSESTGAEFSFTASEASATFQCKLDTAAWSGCESPKRYSGLIDGSHTFQVRAIDPSGNADPTPELRSWRIVTEPPPVDSACEQATADVETAEQRLRYARIRLRRAKQSGEPDRIQIARRAVAAAKHRLDDAIAIQADRCRSSD